MSQLGVSREEREINVLQMMLLHDSLGERLVSPTGAKMFQDVSTAKMFLWQKLGLGCSKSGNMLNVGKYNVGSFHIMGISVTSIMKLAFTPLLPPPKPLLRHS